jgi:hypothetical protein
MVAHDGSVASAAIEFGTVIDGGVVSPGGGGGGGETVEITYTLSGGLVMYRLPFKKSKVIPDRFEPTAIGLPMTVLLLPDITETK